MNIILVPTLGRFAEGLAAWEDNCRLHRKRRDWFSDVLAHRTVAYARACHERVVSRPYGSRGSLLSQSDSHKPRYMGAGLRYELGAKVEPSDCSSGRTWVWLMKGPLEPSSLHSPAVLSSRRAFCCVSEGSVNLNGAQYLNAPRVVGRHADTSNIDIATCASDV
jgi:hypothetical protein